MGGQFLSTGAAGTLHPKIFSVLCAPKITSVESKKVLCKQSCCEVFTDFSCSDYRRSTILMKTRGRIYYQE